MPEELCQVSPKSHYVSLASHSDPNPCNYHSPYVNQISHWLNHDYTLWRSVNQNVFKILWRLNPTTYPPWTLSGLAPQLSPCFAAYSSSDLPIHRHLQGPLFHFFNIRQTLLELWQRYLLLQSECRTCRPTGEKDSERIPRQYEGGWELRELKKDWS